MIVECNGRTLPQERYNAQWVTEQRMGIVLKNFRQINAGVEQLLDPLIFAEFRAKAATYNNRALFEIPEFLEEISDRNHSAARTRAFPSPRAPRLQHTPITPPLESSFAK